MKQKLTSVLVDVAKDCRKAICANPHYGWWIVIASCVVYFCHLTTVEDYPPTWYDEVCMIEWGRFSLFDIAPQWAVDLWKSANGINPPYPYFHYLAGAIYEGLFRLTGHFLAARVWALSSILIVPIMLFRWLTKSHGLSPVVAFLSALMILVDPNVTICAHWYRPDIWSICIFLIFTQILRRINTPACAAFFIGFAIAFNTAFWITSILFAPLYIYELYLWKTSHGVRGQWLRDCILCAVGGLITAAIVLIPQYRVLPCLIDQYAHRSELGGIAKATTGLAIVFQRLADFVKIALRSPFCWMLALLSTLAASRVLFLRIAFVGIVALMLATRVYHLRMVYLIPYLYVFSAITIAILEGSRRRRVWRFLVVMVIIAYVGISVLLLNIAAYPRDNTFAIFKEQLDKALGDIRGEVYIIDFEHECYFALRETGRHPICCIDSKQLFDPDVSDVLLARVDAVVVSDFTSITEKENEFLMNKGFKKTSSFEMKHDVSPGPLQMVRNVIYAHGFPGCAVYTREGKDKD